MTCQHGNIKYWCKICCPPRCDFSGCDKLAVRIITYDSNSYENDKSAWACETCAVKFEVK